MERHFHRLFLRLLLWLLVAALPLQGFAAVARLCCQPVTLSVSKAAKPVPHCHQMADDGAQGTDATHSTHTKQLDHQPGHDCGHAACSVGASAPPSCLPAPVMAPALSLPPLASSRFLAGHIPAGPERPPRIFFIL